jgi:hypothetical protein
MLIKGENCKNHLLLPTHFRGGPCGLGLKSILLAFPYPVGGDSSSDSRPRALSQYNHVHGITWLAGFSLFHVPFMPCLVVPNEDRKQDLTE